jgi:flagellar motility protein MotE (MotC chaperone)
MRAETVTGHDDEAPTSQRYTVREAALLLGLSVDAVRKRAERGSLKKEKGMDGTVYIIFDADHLAHGHATRHDETATSRLVDSLQDQVGYLRRELDIRNEQLRRKDHLLAAALERSPELEAPSESREGSETAASSSERVVVDTPETVAAPQRPTSRPWWKRLFGG